MIINNKLLATLDSVSTHIFVDGGRIQYSAKMDEAGMVLVDSRNRNLIDEDYDQDWYDSMSEEDRVTFCRYRRIQLAQTKDIRFTNILKTFSPLEILINKIALS